MAAMQGSPVPQLVTQTVDDTRLTTLRGNVHPMARPEFDRGAISAATPLNRMLLVLQRSPDQETALRQLLDDQQDKSSPNYHAWLTPDQFGKQFGPADSDVQAVTGWLTSHGFQNVKVSSGRTTIEFSGNAAQVGSAFHTSIHHFSVNGQDHIANTADPQIPQALAPVVTGIRSLHNFHPRPHSYKLGAFRKSSSGQMIPLFTTPGCGGTCYGVGPGDFATIYNTQPLLSASPTAVNGTGVTIAIVGDSNINIQDVTSFRSIFSLPVNNPNIIVDGDDPGLNGDETEADLDVEWSGAVAPGATVDFVVSENSETTAGVDLSAQYVIDKNLAGVMSESFGSCEQGLGSSGNAFYNALWEQAAAQGITVIVSSGDGGAAGCDNFDTATAATLGLAVNGIGSTPFNVSVGGTDFDQNGVQALYWSSTNSASGTSARSYIPEVPWNDSCGQLGINGCGANAPQGSLNIVAGSGGVSTKYSKPVWQVGTGVPSDGHRDLPDLSLFASNGFNGSFYIICEQDAVGSCSLTPNPSFGGVGGTSASAPAFAGIMALVNQKYGRQGIANYVLYALAQAQTTAHLSCNSSSSPVSTCTFNDVTKGNNAVPCAGGTPNCSSTSASTNGVLEATVNGVNGPAYPASTGYDLATGLGSINAQNFVNNWSTVRTTATTTTLTLNSGNPVNITHGQSVPVSISVTPSSATGDVALIGSPSGSSLGMDSFTLTNGAATGSATKLAGGTYTVTAHYEGNGKDAPSDSTPPIQVNVAPEASQPGIQFELFDPTTGAQTSSNATTAPYGSLGLLRMSVTSKLGDTCAQNTIGATGCPTGNVSITNNGVPLDAGTYALNVQGYTEDRIVQLPPGTNSLALTYAGDNSFTAGTANSAIAITQAPTTTTGTLGGTSPTVTIGGGAIIYAQTHTQSVGALPTGNYTVLDGASVVGTNRVNASSASNRIVECYNSINITVGAPSGQHLLTVQYSGDNNYAASTSSPIPVNFVYQIISSISSSATTVGYGNSINLTATFDTTNPASNAALRPTGTVSFSSTSGTISPVATTVTQDSSGNWMLQATATTTPQLSESITANYTGDSNYASGSSSPLSVTVTFPDFSIVSNPSSMTIPAGQTGMATIMVTPTSNSPSSVVFSCPSTLPAGSACALNPSTVNFSNGTATTSLSLTTLPASSGTNTNIVVRHKANLLPPLGGWLPPAATLCVVCLGFLLLTWRSRYRVALGCCLICMTAYILGCGGGGSSSSPAETFANTSLTLSTSSIKVEQGSQVTFTVTVNSPNTVTGSVSLYDGNIQLGTNTLSGGSTTFQLSNLSIGTHQITASYSGDSYNGS
jgi:hypothetical protein